MNFAISRKLGMSQFFFKNGLVIPVTILSIENNNLISIKNYNRKIALVVGFYKKTKNFTNENILKKKYLKFKEFSTNGIKHINKFCVGDLVNVTSLSKGKGFSGVMKRHNFSGLEATHGVSLKHRSSGSTGQCQDPGKIFKGKKMAGHMGYDKCNQFNMEVVDIDLNLKLLILKGSVPGFKNGYVYVRKSMLI